MLEHAVLVDAGFMGEGVLADDRLVVLDRESGDRRDQLRRPHQERRVDAGIVGQDIVAGAQRHDDLLQRGVAGTLAEAVDGAFDLPGASPDSGQRIGDRQAEIVVAVGREHRLIGVRHALHQHAHESVILFRHRVADGIGNIDRGRAGGDRRLDRATEEIVLGAGAVFRRPFDVVGMIAGARHARNHRLVDVFRLHLQLVLHMQRAGRNEGVDSPPFGVLQGFRRAIDILVAGASQSADDGILDHLADLGHRLEVAIGGDREAGLDDVDTQLIEHFGDLQLFLEIHRRAGRLLAVAQRRVENDDAVLCVARLAGGCHCLDPSQLIARNVSLVAGVKPGCFVPPLSARLVVRQPALRGA
jgi:hypothetical protein